MNFRLATYTIKWRDAMYISNLMMKPIQPIFWIKNRKTTKTFQSNSKGNRFRATAKDWIKMLKGNRVKFILKSVDNKHRLTNISNRLMRQDTMLLGQLGSKSMEGRIRMSSCWSMMGWAMIVRVDIWSIRPYSMRLVEMIFQVKASTIWTHQVL